MTYTLSSAQIIKRVPKTTNNKIGCELVDNVPIETPAFVVFGGELTLTEKAANAYAKQIQNLLYENNINNVDVYSVVYNFGSSNSKLERDEIFRVDGRRKVSDKDVSPIVKYANNLTLEKMRHNEPIPTYIKQLFDILLYPRISGLDGKKISPEIAVQRIRKIKFSAHCHGAATIWQMANYMQSKMLELGYSPKTIANIQKELVVVQHSPIAPLTNQKFTTISFASAEDTMMQHHNNLFADWIYENSQDVIPSFFDDELGNIFVAGHLQEIPFKEHSNTGLTKYEEYASPLTEDGQIIFNAERNAITRLAQKTIAGAPVNSVKELTDGNGVDFEQLKQNGNALYKVMLRDLQQQNLKRGYQK